MLSRVVPNARAFTARAASTRACVLEDVDKLSMREIEINEPFTDLDVSLRRQKKYEEMRKKIHET